MKHHSLNDGTQIPSVGLGLFLIPDGQPTTTAVKAALDTGYRHFDTAKFYENEEGLGQALRESGIPRDEYYVTTKLWNSDQGYDSTLRAFDKSFERLGLEYIDLYLVHWPVRGKRLDSWRAMEEIVASGRVKSLGISNYMVNHMQELLNVCKIKPVLNQFELSPYNYLRRKPDIDFCEANGIAVEAYSPLTRGAKLNDPVLLKIGAGHNKTAAQVLIRWCLEMGYITLPKSANPGRIRENWDVWDFSLTTEEMSTLNDLNEDLAIAWDPTGKP